jgi:hypothetical protein
MVVNLMFFNKNTIKTYFLAVILAIFNFVPNDPTRINQPTY